MAIIRVTSRYAGPSYYGFPEHRSDPSIGQSHILAEKRDGVTSLREIRDDTFGKYRWNPDISISFRRYSTQIFKILQCRQNLLITSTF